MKCHYEVLGIERDADDKTIKNAYRKLALKYHPDKNLENIDAAKEQFLLVQQAYDVLSDQHERAWYDNHRDQILRGSHANYEDESLDVFPYFTAACYKGFGDDPQGFYAVYSKVFEQLATEDIEFMESPEEFDEIPKFGISTSNYESIVGPFYAYWQSYCTKKSYAWLCPHNINEIRDRRILREVEKETKKIAQKARKERNEEIRALVAFVRKRDKRVQEYKRKLEEKAEVNRLKQQQHRLQQLRRNQQEAEEMQKTQQKNVFNTSDHEERLRQLEQAYGSGDDSDCDEYDDGDDDDDDDAECGGDENNDTANVENGNVSDSAEFFVDDLYCVACNKAFKNASSYENHEFSKKHRDNIERLKKRMQKEEELFGESDENAEESNDALTNELTDSDAGIEVSDFPLKTKSSKKAKKFKNKIQLHRQSDDEEDDELERLVEKPMTEISIGNVADDGDEADKGDWSDDIGNKKSKKSKNRKSTKASTPSKNASSVAAPSSTEPTSGSVENCESSSASKKLSKKSKKNVNKVASMLPALDGNDPIDISHTCVTCHALFDSKNKLFAHLKKSNHGVYIPKVNGAAATVSAEPKQRGKKR